jgi:hypothetical protein
VPEGLRRGRLGHAFDRFKGQRRPGQHLERRAAVEPAKQLGDNGTPTVRDASCVSPHASAPACRIIWDADFLYGPRDAAGADTYVLCEINVSSCFALPDEAPAAIARTVKARILQSRRASSRG